jgi:phosphatidylethanolamine-binding protein
LIELTLLFTEVASAPEILVIPNTGVTLSGNYTLVMVDANVVGTNQSLGQTRHWLVNNATLIGASFVKNLLVRPEKNAFF